MLNCHTIFLTDQLSIFWRAQISERTEYSSCKTNALLIWPKCPTVNSDLSWESVVHKEPESRPTESKSDN